MRPSLGPYAEVRRLFVQDRGRLVGVNLQTHIAHAVDSARLYTHSLRASYDLLPPMEHCYGVLRYVGRQRRSAQLISYGRHDPSARTID